MKIIIKAILLLVTLNSLFLQAKSGLLPAADLILFNGKIYTVNEQQPMAEAVAVKKSEIVSIEVGKKADFVVLDKNLFEEDKYDIHNVRILQTILDGNTVYSPAK